MSNGDQPMQRRRLLGDPVALLPHLAQFLGAHFHQDWVLEHDSWELVVDEFVGEAPPAAVADTVRELDTLLDAGLAEAELGGVLERLGCSVDPTAYMATAGRWLAAVRARLERPAQP